MKKKSYLMLVFLAMLIMSFNLVSAHQPRLVDKFNLTQGKMVVHNPEISQAFYGMLKGAPEYYEISSDKDFNLYVQILTPDLKDASEDFYVKITEKPDDKSWMLNGSNYTWTKFFEPFAGDSYNQGPSLDENVSSGLYVIEILNKNSNNTGKYVLVFGKQEKFPLNEMLNAFFVMPRLKIYFEKSPFTAYFNRIGIYSLLFLLALAVFIIIIVIIFKVKGKTPLPY